ncbi:MAG TPA: magnesium/cobalt transporter CorA [Solirubrobacteraceae bacterium]|jgi:magnesium transporter|nr:magnesium/cobalt transporter CorA [Solirubrobacteraceae bacterium]
MPINKAEAHSPDRASQSGFSCVVPCLNRIDEKAIKELLASDHFFWLDLTAPTADDIESLRALFGFHPLALEDAREFGQRPKLDSYGDYTFLVFYGARDVEDPAAASSAVGGFLREVQLFVSGKYVVTLHRDELPALDEQRAKLAGVVLHSEQFLLYRVFDALTDSFFPLLARMDDQIDELEDAVLAGPTDEQLQRLFGMKRELVAMRKVVTPQRDLFARSIDELAELPGLQLDERDYFRDVYDHLIRISDLIDSYRDLLSNTTDLYLSTVGNRQNEVMKQLAIVGTIFLPLSFITGFFGMNFTWLVAKAISPTWTFFVLGIGSMLVTCVALVLFFKRKGWM